MIWLRGLIITVVLILIWQLVVVVFHLPPYILPSPVLVAKVFTKFTPLIFGQALFTLFEALVGFLTSILLGGIAALTLIYFRPTRLWFLPVLLISQALPTFAIAPLFVIWFGYGMASKIAVTILMVFFPITSAFYDSLLRTPLGFLDLAQTMGATRFRTLWRVRFPAALPGLGSGLRLGATYAPMGAIIGE
jgi:putative hydroxymethylpyrimidine transport system permease protein